MKRFHHNEIEMLVPHVFGAIEKTKQGIGPSSRKKWDEVSFFEDVQIKLKAPATELIRNLYYWSIENAAIVRFGSGWASGSYTYCFDRDGKIASVFSVYSNGILTMNYGAMKKIFSEDQIQDFYSNISLIPTMKGVAGPEKELASVAIEKAFTKVDFFENFKAQVLRLRNMLIDREN
jgi:hypothetical protein